MAITSNVGLGSGLNIGDLVNQLVAADGQAKSLKLKSREAEITSKISAIGTFKSALSEFQSSMSALKDVATFQTVKATSTDNSQVKVTAATGAAKGSYSIEVSTLAEAHALTTSATNAKAAITDVVGTGTLTFTFAGGTVETVDITDGKLSSIRDAINDANIGVSATLINDGSGYRLSLKSATGLDNAMKITVADGDGNNLDDAGLSILAYDAAGAVGTGKNMTQTQAASDASLVVDGITITSSSNTITSAIDKVTLELAGISTGTPATVVVSQDSSKASTAIKAFKEAYNGLAKALKELTFYDKSTGNKGVFLGEALVRNAQSTLRNVINGTVGPAGTVYNSLAMLGFRTTRDGSFELDETMLTKALTEGIDEVKGLFAGGMVGADIIAKDLSANYLTVPAGVDTSTLDVRITQQAAQGYYGATIGGTFTVVGGGADDNFSLSVNGVATNAITLTAGTYDPAVGADMTSLVTQIQTQLNADANLVAAGVTATASFDTATQQLRITSDTYGSASTVNVVATAAGLPANLGISVGAGTAGVDVAGSVDGQTGTGVGRVLSISIGVLAGLDVEVLSGSYSKDQTIGGKKAIGIANQLNDLLDGYLKSNGTLQSQTDSYNKQIEGLHADAATLERRLQSLQARLMAQYSAMDALVGQLNATGNYLATQLANLPSINRNK